VTGGNLLIETLQDTYEGGSKGYSLSLGVSIGKGQNAVFFSILPKGVHR
jgi:hypothetical protein